MTAAYTGNYDAELQRIRAAQLAGGLPDVAVVVNEHTQLLAPTGILTYYEPGAPNFTQIRDLLHDTTQDILSNKVPLRQGLGDVTSKGNTILAENP